MQRDDYRTISASADLHRQIDAEYDRWCDSFQLPTPRIYPPVAKGGPIDGTVTYSSTRRLSRASARERDIV